MKSAEDDNKPKPDDDPSKLKDYHGLTEGGVAACKENTTILLEILRYHGRDVNIVDMFDLFKKIHREDYKWDDRARGNEAEFEQIMK